MTPKLRTMRRSMIKELAIMDLSDSHGVRGNIETFVGEDAE